jgi:tetratricopeptide (TPR) repeat protein
MPRVAPRRTVGLLRLAGPWPCLAGTAALGFLTLGCASGGAPVVPSPEVSPAAVEPAPEPGIEIRPEANAEYDFLVGRQHELAGELEEALAAYVRAAEKDPGSAYLQRKVGALAWRLGELDRALVHAEQAHQLDPDDPEGRVFLGQIYRLRKETAKAEAMLAGPDGKPLSREAALLLYGMHVDAGRLDAALSVAEWMVAEDPENLRGYFALSRAYEELDRPEQAVKALRDALAQDPGNLSAYSALARLYRDRNEREAEIALYREVLAEYPHHQATLAALADALIATSRSEEARTVLEEIVRYHPDDVRSVIRLALLEFDGGDYESAAERFDRALAESPEDHELAYFLGILRQRMGDVDAALEAFERIPEHHGRYADARTQIATLFERSGDYERALEQARIALRVAPSRALELYVARLRAKQGDLPGAVAMLEAGLAEDPDDDELLYNLGVLYGEAKQFEEALRYMHLALEKNPDNASALNYIGYTWAERGERLDEAEVLIARARELRPDDGYITDSLGWVYYMRALPLMKGGDVTRGRALLQQALSTLQQAAQLSGGDPVISEHLGDVYLLLDEKGKALESYREAVEQEPREGEQPELRRKLESLERELGAQ